MQQTDQMQLKSSGQRDFPQYKHVPLVLILMFCCYVLIWYLQMGERWPALGSIRLEFIYGLILIAIMPFLGVPFDSPLVKFILLYLAMVIVQIPLSHDADHSMDIFFNRVVKFGFMGVFIATFVKSPRDLRLFVLSFMLAWAKMGQEGIYGVLTGGMMWENQGILRLHGSTSLYHHPNSFSGLAVGTLPFIYYLFPVVSRMAKIGLLVMAVFTVNIIVFTGSRTGYVALAIFLILLFFRSKKKKLWAAATIPILVGAVVFTPVEYRQRFMSIFTLQEAEGSSAQTRIQILKDAWQVFMEHPAGVGVGAFPYVRQQMFNRIQDTHNLYLEVATNLGVQGFFAFMLFIGALILTLVANYRSFKEQLEDLYSNESRVWKDDSFYRFHAHVRDLRFMKAVSSAIVTFVIVRLALGMFGMDLYEIYWWFAAGSAIALYKMREVAEMRTIDFVEETDHETQSGEAEAPV
ncbi:MAG: O-antigen ligase family protein [Chitinispirillaceae bacterium]